MLRKCIRFTDSGIAWTVVLIIGDPVDVIDPDFRRSTALATHKYLVRPVGHPINEDSFNVC